MIIRILNIVVVILRIIFVLARSVSVLSPAISNSIFLFAFGLLNMCLFETAIQVSILVLLIIELRCYSKFKNLENLDFDTKSMYKEKSYKVGYYILSFFLFYYNISQIVASITVIMTIL